MGPSEREAEADGIGEHLNASKSWGIDSVSELEEERSFHCFFNHFPDEKSIVEARNLLAFVSGSGRVIGSTFV